MTEQCSRCPRPRPAGPEPAQGAGQPLPFFGKDDEGWASFHGQLVCPQCQTVEERREATYRIVGAIELEIERRRREGASPDAYEAALVTYAMGLREEMGAYTPSEHRSPKAKDERSTGDDQRRLCVAFTAAFLTRHALAVRLDGYPALQQQLRGHLEPSHWQTEGLHASDGTYAGPWGGGFAKGLPLVVARREGAGDLLPFLSQRLHDCQRAADNLERYRPVLAVKPHDLVVDIYDLGVGVLTACVEIRTESTAKLSDVARAVKRMAWLRSTDAGRSQFADELERIANVVAEEYGSAVTASALPIQPAWLSQAVSVSTSSSDRSDEEGAGDHGRLLWLHPVHVLRGEEPADTAASELAPSFMRLITFDGGVFAAGIGSSAVALATDAEGAETPLRLTQLHWAYYALYMAIDRGLLGILNQERWTQQAPLEQLEFDAEDVFADYLRIVDARARLDSHLSSLGGDDFAIWETISKVQRFDALEDAVEHKIEALEMVAKRRVEQATAFRARRMGDILGILAVLTVVTVTGGAVVMLAGAGSPTVLVFGWRVTIVAFALALAIVVYWYAFRRTARAPGPSRRARRRRERALREDSNTRGRRRSRAPESLARR